MKNLHSYVLMACQTDLYTKADERPCIYPVNGKSVSIPDRPKETIFFLTMLNRFGRGLEHSSIISIFSPSFLGNG